jgi:phenylalanyl-tRNA synthetase beta chain
MNILIPDSWLREHLQTQATPKQIKEFVSLCGPSVERINKIGKEIIYDIEVTTNRIDAFSVSGFAREAAVILPESGIMANLLNSAYFDFNKIPVNSEHLDITISNNPKLCRRILAIKLSNIKIGKSNEIIAKRLELVGQRPLNNAIDITNYVMWEIGHPIHCFDYDRLISKKINVRTAQKGETLITLDHIKHHLLGDEIVFDDGTGTIIDLPGIMGTENSVVTDKTKNILLWIECADPVKIRQASMGLSIRTQAAIINEKQPDPETAYFAFSRAVQLYTQTMGATVESRLLDIYPHKDSVKPVKLDQSELTQYLGTEIQPDQVLRILKRLGFTASTQNDKKVFSYLVIPPTWRSKDIQIPEDIIEEVARIYGYHNIHPVIPGEELRPRQINPIFGWEKEIKIRLRDWGFTELYTYSMISEKLMHIFGFDLSKSYKIENPLSEEWVYLRPHLLPSVLETVQKNLKFKNDLKVFELSMVYGWKTKNLPAETPVLTVAWTGEQFFTAKGLAMALFSIFGIEFPEYSSEKYLETLNIYNSEKYLFLGEFGSFGELSSDVLVNMGINKPVTILNLDFAELVSQAKIVKKNILIPKYPPLIEDLSFNVLSDFKIGPFMNDIKKSTNLIQSVELIDAYENSRTIRLTYQDYNNNLSSDTVKPFREKLITFADKKYQAKLKI